jgi:hypothetical protein
MAIAKTNRTYPANYLRASKREGHFVSGKQPSEFTSLRESGQLRLPVRPKTSSEKEESETGTLRFEETAKPQPKSPEKEA